MDFLDVIKDAPIEDLDEIVDLRIEFLEKESLKYNEDVDTIGYLLDYNPTNYYVTEKIPDEITYSMIGIYRGYIRKGTKVVYGFAYDNNRLNWNDGRYYYLDTDDYVYDFCKYIKDKEVIDEYHLFNYVLAFSNKYFGVIEKIDREEMFNRIYKTEQIAYKPVEEHKFSWFKKKGNAKCSEYSIFAQNILSTFGFDMHIIIGSEKDSDSKEEKHAFNFISFIDKEKQDVSNGLMDFSMHTVAKDCNNRIIGYLPYYISLECIDEDFINNFIHGDIKISYPDYDFMVINNKFTQVIYDFDRNYYMGEDKVTEVDINKVLKKR